jgi:hypothetical protein
MYCIMQQIGMEHGKMPLIQNANSKGYLVVLLQIFTSMYTVVSVVCINFPFAKVFTHQQRKCHECPNAKMHRFTTDNQHFLLK